MAQQFMFLLYDDETAWEGATEDDWRREMEVHRAFIAAVEAAGARIVDSTALQNTGTATTLRENSPGGHAVLSDGPFLESKEALGGYYVVETADLDAAIALARRCPSANIEIRPVLDLSGR